MCAFVLQTDKGVGRLVGELWQARFTSERGGLTRGEELLRPATEDLRWPRLEGKVLWTMTQRKREISEMVRGRQTESLE